MTGDRPLTVRTMLSNRLKVVYLFIPMAFLRFFYMLIRIAKWLITPERRNRILKFFFLTLPEGVFRWSIVLLLCYLCYLAYSEDVVILDPISVPKQFADMGLTSDLITLEVKEHIQEIDRNQNSLNIYKTLFDKTSTHVELASFGHQNFASTDIVIPSTKFSLQAALDVIRRLIRKQPKHIGGSISAPDGDPTDIERLDMRVWMAREGSQVRIVSLQHKGMTSDDIAQTISEGLEEILNPFAMGVYYETKGDFAQVSQIGNSILMNSEADSHTQALGHFLIGNAAADQHNDPDAIVEYEKANALDSKIIWVHLNLGIVYLNEKRNDDAIRELQSAIRIDKSFSPAHYLLGIAFFTKNPPDRTSMDSARGEFEKVIRLEPTALAGHLGRGQVLMYQFKFDEAIIELRKAIQMDQTSEQPHYWLGMALNHQGKYDEAIREFREAIRIKPDAATHVEIARLLQAHGKYDDAIAELREAIRLKADSFEAHKALGVAYYNQNELDLATIETNEAIRLNPKDADAYVGLGLIAVKRSRTNDAIAAFQKALRIDPENVAAKKALDGTLKKSR